MKNFLVVTISFLEGRSVVVAAINRDMANNLYNDNRPGRGAMDFTKLSNYIQAIVNNRSGDYYYEDFVNVLNRSGLRLCSIRLWADAVTPPRTGHNAPPWIGPDWFGRTQEKV